MGYAATNRTALASVLFFLVSLPTILPAAAPVDNARPKFQSETNLVLVPTIVHDKSGAHIPNLEKKNFSLFDEGHERPIAVFEEVRPGNQIVKRPQLAPGMFTNVFNDRIQPNRLTLIALDTITTPELRQTRAREDLLKMLAKTIQTNSMVGLVLITTSGTRVVHDFTTDPKVLIEALNNVIGSEPIAQVTTTTSEQSATSGQFQNESNLTGEAQLRSYYLGELERKAADLERRVAVEQELAAMEQIGQALRGVPGRKSLIWVGAGFPLTISGATLGEYTPDSESLAGTGVVFQNPVSRRDPTSAFKEMLPAYEHLWKALNDANVAVYGIDVRGLTTTNESAAVRLWSPNERQRQHYLDLDTKDTFQVFADVTGGRAYTNTNDFTKAYDESLQDDSAYYLLGYYVDRKEDKSGWHDVSVKVSRPGSEVRSRRGFFLRTKENKDTQDRDLELALLSPLDYTGLPVIGRWTGTTGKGQKRKVGLLMLLPAGVKLIDDNNSNHLDLEFFVRAQDAQGKTVAHSAQEMEGHLTDEVAKKIGQEGVRYESTMDLPPGEYTVHFVVRDKLTDRIGSVSAPLKIEQEQAEAK